MNSPSPGSQPDQPPSKISTEPPPYRRIPGTGGFIISYFRLYLGSNHILQVQSNGFSEEYRRFQFKDIQAVVIRKTFSALIISLILWAAIVICALVYVATSIVEVQVFFLIIGMILLVIALFHMISGTSCITHLQTAAGSTRLRSLTRLRKARDFVQKITPLLEDAQGLNLASSNDASKSTSHSSTMETKPPAGETEVDAGDT